MTNKYLARKTVSEEKDVLTTIKESVAPVLLIVIDETETEKQKEEIPAPEPAPKPVATMTIVER